MMLLSSLVFRLKAHAHLLEDIIFDSLTPMKVLLRWKVRDLSQSYLLEYSDPFFQRQHL